MSRKSFVWIAFAVAALQACSGLQGALSAQRADNTQPPRIVVPVARASRVVIDGTFSPGEWDGAFRQPLGDNFEVYLLADSENLYVGFKFLKDVEASFLSEVYVATSDRQFVNLHSSGALGEGVNDFPLQGGRTRFSVVTPPGGNRATGWESNATPRETRVQGKEFKINRAKLPGATVRLAAVMMVVNSAMRETGNFPKDHGFSSADGWAELVLPAKSARPDADGLERRGRA